MLTAAVLSGCTLIPALRDNAILNAGNAELAKAVSGKGRALMFVDTYPGYLRHPTAVVANSSPPGGQTIYALHKGADDFEVLRPTPGDRGTSCACWVSTGNTRVADTAPRCSE